MVFGIAVNLIVLGYFKYTNFFIETINETLALGWTFTNIVLPLAISFFTFQQIAFLVEVKREIISEFSFQDYLLFVVFFPQLIAGPIVHFNEVCDQYRSMEYRRRPWVDVAVGLSILTIGLFKKVVFADTLAFYADPVFAAANAGTPISFVESWTALLAFTAQIYFDFSGYSDMAIGLARLFGIRLPMNFFSPYKADSIIEFWRRWHMTLSRFLREYLYIPMGGNREGNLKRDINIMVTMLIAGLWHGAAWTFVVWGGLHGLYMIINHRWCALRYSLGFNVVGRWPSLSRVFRLLAIGVTFFFVMVAWVFFRSETFGAANLVIIGMVGGGGFTLPASYEALLGPLANILKAMGWTFNITPFWGGAPVIAWLVPAYICLWLLPNTQQIFCYYRPTVIQNFKFHSSVPFMKASTRKVISLDALLTWRANSWNGCWIVGLAVISLIFILVGHDHEFIYFQF
ncbi:MAG: alginate O-acetylation protein [Nitrospirales bacterium]|nr:MAG: alginate O-acetylation protein [Nitrospirales bacterium]